SLKSGERKEIFNGGSDARYVPTGQIVYALGTTLLAVPFNERTLALTGGPVPITEHVARSRPTATAATFFAFSNTGTMAYFNGDVNTPNSEVALFDLKGGRKTLPLPPAVYQNPRISPDGKQMVLQKDGDSTDDVALFVYDLSGATSIRRLT